MEKVKLLKLCVWLFVPVTFGLFLSTSKGFGQDRSPTTHTIFMSVIEVKGGTSADNLAPPPINPKDLSKGYEFKPPPQPTRVTRRGGRYQAT